LQSEGSVQLRKQLGSPIGKETKSINGCVKVGFPRSTFSRTKCLAFSIFGTDMWLKSLLVSFVLPICLLSQNHQCLLASLTDHASLNVSLIQASKSFTGCHNASQERCISKNEHGGVNLQGQSSSKMLIASPFVIEQNKHHLVVLICFYLS
jgi:hypothetical protein